MGWIVQKFIVRGGGEKGGEQLGPGIEVKDMV